MTVTRTRSSPDVRRLLMIFSIFFILGPSHGYIPGKAREMERKTSPTVYQTRFEEVFLQSKFKLRAAQDALGP